MATERAPLSSLTNLPLQNRLFTTLNKPVGTLNKPVQRDTCDSEKRHDSTTRVMGTGKCTVVLQQLLGERVFCLCRKGVFNYNGTSNVLDVKCQVCHHTVAEHESLSVSKGGRSVSSSPLHIIESPLTSQIIQTTLLLKLRMPIGPHQGYPEVGVLIVSETLLANHQ